MDSTYINKFTETVFLARRKIKMIIGGVGAIFFCVGLIPGVMSTTDYESPGSLVALSGVMVAVFGLIFYSGYKLGKDVELAYRYSLVFAGDKNGVVTYSELAKAMNLTESDIAKQLDRLFKKRLFKDCTLELKGAPCVKLYSTTEESGKDGFVTIKCPHCDGTATLRVGTTGRCEYCGGAIKA
ncbi:MAG: hypothetical protein K6A38_04130 [Lachnospiraceae bacterium]|nr:hypothetical protein [Lachnospiraceae bacterium]